MQMLTRNFEEFPEHRQRFYQLLKAVVNSAFQVTSHTITYPHQLPTHAFYCLSSDHMCSWCLCSDLTCGFALCVYVQAILMLNPEQQKLVVDSIVWGFKHTDRNIAEIGLEILHDLLMVRTTRVLKPSALYAKSDKSCMVYATAF
jgi:exportin-1